MTDLQRRLDELKRKRAIAELEESLSNVPCLTFLAFEEPRPELGKKLRRAKFEVISEFRALNPFADETVEWIKGILKAQAIEGEYLFGFNERKQRRQDLPFALVRFECMDWVQALWRAGGGLYFLSTDYSSFMNIGTTDYTSYAEKVDLTSISV